MKNCKECGNPNDDSSSFCKECGATLNSEQVKQSRTIHKGETNSKQGKKSRNILFALIAVIVIGLFTGYQVLAKKYSEEAVIEQFNTALMEKDTVGLKQLIHPRDSRLKVNDQSFTALFALIDKEPSLIQDIERTLRKEELEESLFSLRTEGKHYGLFNRYIVDAHGYFITVKDNGEDTKIYLNENEIGALDNVDETKEFGPFLGGIYTVKGLNGTGDQEMKDAVNVKLSGTVMKQDVTLNTVVLEEEPEEPEEVKERTVIKEVIREVPVSRGGSYYLIPDSDYYYLSYGDISSFTTGELRLARNEIYARYGYIFDSKDLQKYFSSQAWYSPNPNYDGQLTSLEKDNVDFIKSYE